MVCVLGERNKQIVVSITTDTNDYYNLPMIKLHIQSWHFVRPSGEPFPPSFLPPLLILHILSFNMLLEVRLDYVEID